MSRFGPIKNFSTYFYIHVKGHYKLLTSDRLSEWVKIMSFDWLKANMHSFALVIVTWGQHPLLCMGVLV